MPQHLVGQHRVQRRGVRASSDSPADREVLMAWAKDLLHGLISKSGQPGMPKMHWFFEELGLAELATLLES
jgi:hypothetical protein